MVLFCFLKNEAYWEKNEKEIVQLESAYWVIVDSEGNGPLSFHRQEREVDAAL